MNKFIAMLMIMSCMSCAVTGLNYKAGIEDENRPKDTRYGVSSGVEVVFQSGLKTDVSYRCRVQDFTFDNKHVEHDVLWNINVPVWKSKK
jgi:hypothetical protein